MKIIHRREEKGEKRIRRLSNIHPYALDFSGVCGSWLVPALGTVTVFITSLKLTKVGVFTS